MTNHRLQGRRAQKSGANAEALVRQRLLALGLCCVERIETGFKLTRINGKIVGAYPAAKVSGDFRAVVKGTGVSVLVEVKSRPNILRWSDMEAHQIKALDDHNVAGGVSLLAWVSRYGLSVMRWPIPTIHFKPRLSLQWETAQVWSL